MSQRAELNYFPDYENNRLAYYAVAAMMLGGCLTLFRHLLRSMAPARKKGQKSTADIIMDRERAKRKLKQDIIYKQRSAEEKTRSRAELIERYKTIFPSLTVDNCHEHCGESMQYFQSLAADKDAPIPQILMIQYLLSLKDKNSRVLQRKIYQAIEKDFSASEALNIYSVLAYKILEANLDCYQLAYTTLMCKIAQLDRQLNPCDETEEQKASLSPASAEIATTVCIESKAPKQTIKKDKIDRENSLYITLPTAEPLVAGGIFMPTHVKVNKATEAAAVKKLVATADVAAPVALPAMPGKASRKKPWRAIHAETAAQLSSSSTVALSADETKFSTAALTISNNFTVFAKKENVILAAEFKRFLPDPFILATVDNFLTDHARLIGSLAFSILHQKYHGDRHALAYPPSDVDFVATPDSLAATKARTSREFKAISFPQPQYEHEIKTATGVMPFQLTVKEKSSANSISLTGVVLLKNTRGDFCFKNVTPTMIDNIRNLTIDISFPQIESRETLFMMRLVKVLTNYVVPGPYTLSTETKAAIRQKNVEQYLQAIYTKSPWQFAVEMTRFIDVLTVLANKTPRVLHKDFLSMLRPMLKAFFNVINKAVKLSQKRHRFQCMVIVNNIYKQSIPAFDKKVPHNVYLQQLFSQYDFVELSELMASITPPSFGAYRSSETSRRP